MVAFAIDNKKMMKNTLVLYFRMAFTMVVSFFTTRVTLEVLGVEDYGLNNLVGGVVAMFSFINSSMGTAVQRFFCIEIGQGNLTKLKVIFGCGLYLHIIVAIITLLLAEIFAFFFLEKLNIPIERLNAAQAVFQFAMISMFFNIINVPYVALLRAREEFAIIAKNDILISILRLGVLYCLYFIAFDKLVLLALLNFIISVFSVVYLTLKARIYEEARSFICRNKEIIREMITFVSMLLLTVLTSILRENGMIILVNLFFGLVINAAFAIAFQVTMMMTTFVMNFKQSIIPQLMAAWGAGDVNSVYKLINWGTKITFVLMLVISVPIILECDYLLKIWLTTPPEFASNLVRLGVISVNISSFTYFFYQAVHATGHIKLQQITMSFSYILNILLIYIMLKFGFNFYYCYYVTIVISLLQCGINLYYAARYVKIDINSFCSDIIGRCILACVSVVALLYFVLITNMESSFLRLLLITFFSTFFILIEGYFILLNKQERELLVLWMKSKWYKKRHV